MVVHSPKTIVNILFCAAFASCMLAVLLFFFGTKGPPPLSPQSHNHPFLCSGVYDFTVSASDGMQSLVTEGTLSPCDPQMDTLQTFRVLAHPNAENVEAHIITDTKDIRIPFVKNPKKPTEWRAVWMNSDTYNHTYTIIIKGRMGNDEKEIPITFR